MCGVSARMGRGDKWLGAAVTVAVCCALFGMCDGDYEPKSILCDDVDAICAKNGFDVTNVTECGSNERKFLNPAICNCGLKCIENLKEGDSCLTSSLVDYPTKMCGPGLECKEDPSNPRSSRCIRNADKKCINELMKYEAEQEVGTLGPGRNKPNCDEYGSYAPTQCSPSSTCYCVTPEGERVFGETLFSHEKVINCKCSLYWEDTEKKGLNLGMRCLSNGNFDSLQCIDTYCFCYSDTNDTVTYGPVPKYMIKFMPCYDKEIHFESYTNPCHSAQEAWNNQGIDADVIVAEVPKPVCSRDGYYAAVQYLAGKAFCADRNGNPIENYELPIHEAGNMNCHCPRRRKIMEENGYGASKPKCCSDGQYYPWQTRGPHSYCVDDNGNQYGETVTITNIQDLPCYTNTPCSAK